MEKVSIRGGFSDRNGIKPVNTEIQIYAFDDRTRIQLVNMMSNLYSWVYKNNLYRGNADIQMYLRFVLSTVFSIPVDTRKSYDDDRVIDLINKTIQYGDYDDVLSLIEGIVQYWDEHLKLNRGYLYYNQTERTYTDSSIFEVVNLVFEREYIGYRFINGIIVPISDDYELSAIRDAFRDHYQIVAEHLAKASQLLADRNHPDYENSIKESISAVEAMCEQLTGIKGKEATLGNMLKTLETNGVEIHGGLKSAFHKLYGYTSDANGIRHAGDIGGPSSTFAEAKFMLVSCSAFINYLKAVCAE